MWRHSPHRWNWCCFVVTLGLLQFTLFCREICFVMIHVHYVEKNWTKNCICGEKITNMRYANKNNTTCFTYFPTIFSNGTYRRIAKNDDVSLLLKENVCFSSAFSSYVCFRESFREGHRERQREIRNIVMLPHCHIAILLLSCWLIAVLKTKHRGHCSCCPSNHCSVCIDCRM